MRVRSRSADPIGPLSYTQTSTFRNDNTGSTSVLHFYGVNNIAVNAVTSNITDVYPPVKFKGNVHRKKKVIPSIPRPCNPVFHSKDRCKPIGNYVSYSLDSGAFHYREEYNGETGTPFAMFASGPMSGYAASPAGSLTDYSDTDWYTLSSKFYEALDSYVSPSLLIGEDLIENDVFVDAFKIILNPSRAVRTLIKSVKHLGVKKNMPFGRVVDIARKSAGSTLAYNFGIRPAVEDVKKLLGAHAFVKARLEFLRKNRAQWVRVGVVSRQTPSVSPSYVNDGISRIGSTYTSRTKESRMTAWGRVRNDINYKGNYAAYAEYFGLQHVVGLAWELIPYSFLLDWVSNAQARIRNITRLHFGGPFSEISGISSSEKTTDVVEIYISPGYNTTIGMNLDSANPIQVGERSISSYWRSPFPPDSSQFLFTPELKTFQLITGTALLIQNVTS